MALRAGPVVQQGFTLLEMMVTLVVVAILAGAVLLKPPNNQSQILATTAAQLRAYLVAVSADATRRNENRGIVFESNSVQLLSFSLDSGWQTANGGSNKFELPSEIQLIQGDLMNTANDASARYTGGQITPDVVLLASGELVPFELQLSHTALDGERFVVRSDGLNIEFLSL